jgi:ATP-dependent RNA helicase DeaD
MTTFQEFELDEALVAAVEKLGFESATPIQAATIPAMLAGQDVIGRARTGSGKTAAFGLPMLERLKEGGKKPRGLILAPTRELALQVSEALRSFSKSLPIKVITIYGGAPYPPQLKALRNEPGIVVGTPGRVIDHIQRGTLDLSCVEMFVIDEADEMLRMGFIEPVQEILECLPEDRQIALFSATMPPAIQKVSARFLRNPTTIQVESSSLTTEHIEQFWIRAPMRKKIDALIRLLLTDPTGYTLIFARTRRGCAEICDLLIQQGISADAIHGDLNQAARERVLNRMRSKSLRVLVATDVAARGLDVSHLSRVINVDYPESAETYTHRIGRTGRAGAHGQAITFVTPSEQYKLRFLKKAIKYDIQEMYPPTNAEIAEHQRSVLWAEVETVLTTEDLEHEAKWIEEQCADSEVEPLALAAAAIRMLNDSRGMSLAPPKPEPKQHRRENREDPANRSQRSNRGPRDDAEFSRVNEVEIFVGVGKFAGVRPGDIVGAFANEFGVSGSDIGRVMLFEKNAFVGLPKAVAEHVLDKHEKVTIRGRTTYLSLARGRSGSGGGDDGHGPPTRRKHKGKHLKKGPTSHHRHKKFKR